jgi:hypothetical protein
MDRHHSNLVISQSLLDGVFKKIDSPMGRELVSTLVRVGDDIDSAIDKLAYEYKYRCVVDDEMGPANGPIALDLSEENLEHAILTAKQALEEIAVTQPVARLAK